jgi:hypothetical protein
VSPILDLQKRLVELGRLRQGTTTPGTSSTGRTFNRPVKLDTWRLTSRDESLVLAAAELYGGNPQPWRDGAEWEVITETDQLDILVIPGQTLSQYWELWGQPNGKGAVSCLRRCDGYEQTDGSPCACPGDYDERREQAAEGKACKPITRLSVVLPRLPGIGQWRLEARGFYAAVELSAATGLIERASQAGALLPARLRLEQRSKAQDGQTITYRVPVIALDVAPTQLAAIAAGEAPEALALPASTLTRPDVPDVAAGLVAAEAQKDRVRSQGRQAAPLGPAAAAPSTAPIGSEEEPPAVGPDGETQALTNELLSLAGSKRDEVARHIEAHAGRYPDAHKAWLGRQLAKARKDPGPEAAGEPAGAEDATATSPDLLAAGQPAPDEPLFQAPALRPDDRG